MKFKQFFLQVEKSGCNFLPSRFDIFFNLIEREVKGDGDNKIGEEGGRILVDKNHQTHILSPVFVFPLLSVGNDVIVSYS